MDLREESKKCLKILNLNNDIIVQIEKSIYNRALDQAIKKGIHKSWKNQKFSVLYEDIFRHIMNNLDPESHVQNKSLLERLKNDPELANNIANMSMEELFPGRWEHEYKEKETRENILNNRKINENSFLKCKKCKSKRVMVTMLALRSADEGLVAMKVCQDCGFMSKS